MESATTKQTEHDEDLDGGGPKQQPKLRAVKRALIGAFAEAEEAVTELSQAAREGNDVTKRAEAARVHASSTLMGTIGSMGDLQAAEKEQVKPLAEKVLCEMEALCTLAASGSIGELMLESMLGAELGPLEIKGALARASGVKAAEVESTIGGLLDAAFAAIEAAVDNFDPLTPVEPTGDLGLTQLAGATALLHGAGDHKKLIETVRKMSGLVGRLPDGKRKEEVLVRLSDVRQALGLERLTSENMAHVIQAEQAELKPKVTDQQRKAFTTAIDSVHDGLSGQFDRRIAAVNQVWHEAEEKDPPREPSIWAEIAIAALSAAAAALFTPMAGALVAGIAGKVGGAIVKASTKTMVQRLGKKGAAEFFERQAKHIEEISKAAFEHAVLATVDAQVKGLVVGKGSEGEESESEHKQEGGSAGGAAGVNSQYFKDAFFGYQVQALLDQRDHRIGPAMQRLRDEEAHLSADPEHMVAAAEVAAHAAHQPPAAEVVATQLEHSRQGYVKAMAKSSITETEYYFSSDPDKSEKEVTKLDKALSTDRDGFDKAVNGVISLGFEIDPTDPQKAVKLQEAWAYGLNEGLRKSVAKLPLLTGGIPVRGRSETARSYVSVAHAPGSGYKGRADGDLQHWMVVKGGGWYTNDDGAYDKAAQVILEKEIGDTPLEKRGIEVKKP